MREKPASIAHLFSWTELDGVLGECDIVLLSCALTPETMDLINGRRLAVMKPSAFLINLARGPIAEEQALYHALRDGVIGGAALDTWWRYPSADDCVLFLFSAILGNFWTASSVGSHKTLV